MLKDQLATTPLVPLVQTNEPETALRIVSALADGGLPVVEVVLRTEKAVTCLSAIAKELPEVTVGAGTVLNKTLAEEVIGRGAQFIVSPGLDRELVSFCQGRDIDILPGTVTPSEMMAAVNLGLETVKFFPAALSGGPSMLKAAASVFGGLRFMPTGGVTAETLPDYLAIPAVLACGGSWLTPREAVEAQDYAAITQLAEEAVQIAARVRPPK
ncbi:MAG: bifunctional 4-hydroxy-2-oxoglutarate aldolase/2-dehydro-3-deoxy-phosphogluconate aldolase [Parvularcula sp.]